jgi:hypothetical protein
MGIAVERDRVLLSRDGGEHWQPIDAPIGLTATAVKQGFIYGSDPERGPQPAFDIQVGESGAALGEYLLAGWGEVEPPRYASAPKQDVDWSWPPAHLDGRRLICSAAQQKSPLPPWPLGAGARRMEGSTRMAHREPHAEISHKASVGGKIWEVRWVDPSAGDKLHRWAGDAPHEGAPRIEDFAARGASAFLNIRSQREQFVLRTVPGDKMQTAPWRGSIDLVAVGDATDVPVAFTETHQLYGWPVGEKPRRVATLHGLFQARILKPVTKDEIVIAYDGPGWVGLRAVAWSDLLGPSATGVIPLDGWRRVRVSDLDRIPTCVSASGVSLSVTSPMRMSIDGTELFVPSDEGRLLPTAELGLLIDPHSGAVCIATISASFPGSRDHRGHDEDEDDDDDRRRGQYGWIGFDLVTGKAVAHESSGVRSLSCSFR